MSDVEVLPPADEDPRFGRGGNNPPSLLDLPDRATLLNAAVMADQFDLDYAAHYLRRDELLAGIERFFAETKKITTEGEQARAADFAGQLKLFAADVEADRAREARPILDAQAVIQKKFKREILDLILPAAADIEKKMKPFAEAKAAERRRQLDQEAREAAAAAKKATEEAEASLRPSQLEKAVELAQASEAADQRLVRATTAGLGRSRGNYGSVATLRTSFVSEVVDLAAVPREWMMLDQAKVDGAIANGVRDGADGTPAIPGLRIVETTDVKVRP